MCGICGIYSNRKLYEQEISEMTAIMAHRGPDAHGYLMEEVADGEFIALGHRRLSIIDLSDRANQPMHDENNRVSIVFNGEIYNYIEIREDLKRAGYLFRTDSDTEVLLKAYLRWGLDFLKQLNGMFAIGIWDRQKKELFLARDRMGIKPLYYFKRGKIFAFSSELKALTKISEFKKDLDYSSLNDYFSLQYVPSPLTIFRDVYKIKPGYYMLFKNNKIELMKYWDIKYSKNKLINNTGEIKDRLKILIDDAVKKRMISDVPLGAFLSGGIDSTIVVANMSKRSTMPVKTFTIGFDTKGFKDEIYLARITSKRYETDHHEEILKIDNFIDLLPNLVHQMDEPFADHSIIPTFLVSMVARKNVTVALSGDGGDENFGGYPRNYLFAKYFGYYKKIPEFLTKIFESGIKSFLHLFLMNKATSLGKLNRIIEIFSTKGDEQVFSHQFLLPRDIKYKLYDPTFKDFINNKYDISIFDKNGIYDCIKDKVQWAMCYDLKHYLVDDILTKVDRMSMLNSLEVRVPFLDHRIVELGLKIPGKYKVNKKSTKWILKETFKNLIPRDVFRAKKKGFGIPLKIWWDIVLKDFAKEILLDKKTEKRKLFNMKYLEKLLNINDFIIEKWSLLVFEIWARKYLL